MAELAKTAGAEARGKIIIELNDMIVNSPAIIAAGPPRPASRPASKTLGGVEMNAWDSELWNVADWYRVK